MFESDPLLRCRASQPGAIARLVLIAHAGGNAASYRSIVAGLQPTIECHCVQLPGRAGLAEPPVSSIAVAARQLAAEIVLAVRPPYAIFGHSMGGMIAYETMSILAARSAVLPVRLFLSGFRAPHLFRRTTPIVGLSETAFVAAVQRLYGELPAALLNAPDFLKLYMAVLRSDLKLMDAHPRDARVPLDIPLTVMGGKEDNAAPAADLSAWAAYAGAGIIIQTFSGGHLYLIDRANEVSAAIAARLLADVELPRRC